MIGWIKYLWGREWSVNIYLTREGKGFRCKSMGIISKSIFKDILSLVLENRFRDRATDPQHDALFEILNREDVFAILTD